MKNYRVAIPYARALFELAEAEGGFDEFYKEFLEATDLIARHPKISHLLMSTTIAREEKEDFIEKILPEGTSVLLVNFLKVLIRKRRFQALDLIVEKFQELYEEGKGIHRVRVEAAIPLGEVLQEKLRRALEKRMKGEVILESVVNPEILGGFILDFDGTQIDASFRTVLHELKQKLSVS